MQVLSTLKPIALQISNLLHWYSDPHEADDLEMMYRSQLKGSDFFKTVENIVHRSQT